MRKNSTSEEDTEARKIIDSAIRSRIDFYKEKVLTRPRNEEHEHKMYIAFGNFIIRKDHILKSLRFYELPRRKK